MANPSHFNVFDLDKKAFLTDISFFDLYVVLAHYVEWLYPSNTAITSIS